MILWSITYQIIVLKTDHEINLGLSYSSFDLRSSCNASFVALIVFSRNMSISGETDHYES